MMLAGILWLILGVTFVDEASRAGLDFKHVSGSADKSSLLDTMSGGIAWIDFDGDGRLDLYLVNGGRWPDLGSSARSVSNALYRNNGDGTFSEVTQASGTAGRAWGMGVAVADFDNDGDSDFYLCNYGPNQLFRNNGDGTFTDIAATSGTAFASWSSTAAWGDYDLDGDLDLYVANYVELDFEKAHTRTCRYRTLQVHCGPKGMLGAADVLYRNNGDGTFTDVSQPSGISSAAPSFGLGAVWGDADNDGDPDLYVANDSRANFLFLNQGDGTFREQGLLSGTAFSEDGNAQAGMGIAWADYDQDRRPDIFVTHFSDDYNTLYRNQGSVLFRDVSYRAGLAFSSRQYLGWATRFFDYDNDGRLDLLIANGHVYPQVDDFQIGTTYRQPKLLYRNLGQGRFQNVTASSGPALSQPASSRGAAFADFDRDGDIDVAVNNLDGSPQLLVNQGGHLAGHWLSLRLRGRRSNRDAVGAQVILQAEGIDQALAVRAGGGFQSSDDLALHFGLGANARASKIEVRWPSGMKQAFSEVQADRRLLLIEGEAELKEEKAPR